MRYILGFGNSLEPTPTPFTQNLYTEPVLKYKSATVIFAKRLVHEKGSPIVDYIACTALSTSNNVR